MPPYIAGQIRAALKIAREANDRRAHLREISRLARTAARGGISVPGERLADRSRDSRSNEAALRRGVLQSAASRCARFARRQCPRERGCGFRLTAPRRSRITHAECIISGASRRSGASRDCQRYKRESRKSSRFFITGTDTNVGKTVVSALLCAALGAIYWKPIQTGTARAAIAQQ